MPRYPRLFIPGATYHVYCRIARGEFVFADDVEAVAFVETLKEVRDLDGWTILAWCLMGNHYHLVVKTRTVDLWRSMARLQGRVSRAHNRRRDVLGRLWQSRYRARVIDTDEYFRQVVSYVHLNPVAAGIVDDPAEFVLCGHREIIGRCEADVIDRRSALLGFSGDTTIEAVDDYLHCVRSVAEVRWSTGGVRDLPWWAPARHVDEIAIADQHRQAQTFDGQQLPADRAELELSEFVDRYQSVSRLEIRDLASRHRSTRHLDGRIEFTVLAASRYGLKACDIAMVLCKGRNTITRWLNHGLHREQSDPEFAARLNALDCAISRR